MTSPQQLNEESISPPSIQNQLPVNNREANRKTSDQQIDYDDKPTKKAPPKKPEPIDVDDQVVPAVNNKGNPPP